MGEINSPYIWRHKHNLAKLLLLLCASICFVSVGSGASTSGGVNYVSVGKRKALQKFINLQVSTGTAPEVAILVPNYDMDLTFCLRTSKEALYSVTLPLNFKFHFPPDPNSVGLVSWENGFRAGEDMHFSGNAFSWHLSRLRHIASCIKTTATQIQFWYSQLIRYKNAPKVDSLTSYGIKMVFLGRAGSKLTLYQENTSPFHLADHFTIESAGVLTDFKAENPSQILLKDLFQMSTLSPEQRKLLMLFN